MSFLRDLASLMPGSRIVASYLGELDRLFAGILWVTCRPRQTLGKHWWRLEVDCGRVRGGIAALYDVTGLTDCPWSVVNVEQLMSAPNDVCS